MAARLNRHHTEDIRQKIQASVLVDRLHRCAMGELEMSKTQVSAACALLDRSVPKLQTLQHVGPNGGAIQVESRLVIRD